MSPKKKKIRHESPLTGQATGAISSAASNTKRRKKPNSEKPLPKKAQLRARKEALEAMEEERLTAMLFGGGITKYDGASSSPVPIDNDYEENNLDEEASDDENEREENLKFEIDRGGDQSSDNDGDSKEEEFRQAWNDEDDDDDAGEHAMVMDNDNDDDDDDDEDNIEEHAAPAWKDPDDSKTALIDGNSRLKKLRRSRQETEALSSHELEQRLRERYEASSQSTARTDWATKTKHRKIKTDDDDEDNDEAALALFSTSKSLLASSRNQLPANILNLVRCPDANLADPNKAVVRCIDFHPASDPGQPLMLTAGLDKTLRFFQIGEERSEKIHGIHFPEMPIYSASFLGDTGKVVLSGRRKFFYFYDMISGKVDLVPSILGRDERSWERHSVSPDGKLIAFVGNDGYVVLVDSHSKQSVGSLKLNGSVRAITFTPDGSELLASGSDGDIYRWDVNSRRCIERFSNGDGTITSSLAASNTSLAVGAESGVVNLYSEHRAQQSRSSLLGGVQTKTPLKSIMNLPTSADIVSFNSDGQILAMSSQREQHGLKLLHVPSRTVFSNWPTAQTPLGYVYSIKFSPGSKFLAMGNDKGKCLLYKINHYHN
eukprot:CAMPEP_0168235846 /NCGR_PEP_ID=MMETSP0140_2-20121125/19157_1 /TAXON_ID=44445 /ORGANISM="Pseudo-nitzschia australis, Strain 10249 10 AB" /LENGTH=601 /DNA_ID=CAMNT_0008169013 /DNA_START=42 /DNA_END=1847 /DNA_ORIENTATION=-